MMLRLVRGKIRKEIIRNHGIRDDAKACRPIYLLMPLSYSGIIAAIFSLANRVIRLIYLYHTCRGPCVSYVCENILLRWFPC